MVGEMESGRDDEGGGTKGFTAVMVEGFRLRFRRAWRRGLKEVELEFHSRRPKEEGEMGEGRGRVLVSFWPGFWKWIG